MNEKVNINAFYQNRLILLNLPLQTIIYLQQQTLLNDISSEGARKIIC